MSIVKFEFSVPELRKALEIFSENRVKAFDAMVVEVRQSVSNAVNQLLNAEMGLFLGTPEQSDNKRNGYYERDYALKGVGTLRVRVPIDRKRRFESNIILRHERIDPRLSEDMAALHLAGLSTRTLALMGQRILGLEMSHQTVSNSLPQLREQAVKWLTRPIDVKYWALIVDGTYFSIRRRGSVEKEPSLVILGIDDSNRRSILSVEPGLRDSADAWRSAFRELKKRGFDGTAVKVGVMDGLPGLEKVFKEEFPNAVTARCWFHAMQNALAKTPKRLHESFHILLKRVMYAKGHLDAKDQFAALKEAMNKDCERAVSCVEKDLESLISHYQFDSKLWKALKTSNAVERVHKEFKRRSKAMEAMGEATLTTLIAFTALRLEMTWQRRALDTYATKQLGRKSGKGLIIETIEEEVIVN